MKCPVCGQELRPGKKDPNYLLCYTCKKKYKAPKHTESEKKTTGGKKASETKKMPGAAAEKTSGKKSSGKKKVKSQKDEEQEHSNIPPKHVRDKREAEMRKAYDELLAVGDGKSKKKKAKRTRDYEEDYEYDYDEFEDEKVSKAPIIFLGIAIIVVAAVIAYMLLK